MQRSHLERQTTSELLCLPFLDTDTAADLPVANSILRDRGYPPRLIRFLRVICGIGLWHQFLFMWDWACLDIWDVTQGYAMLLVPIGIVVTLVSSVTVGLVFLAGSLVAFCSSFAGMARARKRRERDAA